MTFETFLNLLSTNGLAVVLVIWGCFKVDKFLIKICACLDTYNTQLVKLDKTVLELSNVIKNLEVFKK